MEDGDPKEVDENNESEVPQLPPSQAAARFYFELGVQLIGEDITKWDQLNDSNIYLCLNLASLLKDRAIKQQNELRKIQQERKR